MNPRTFVKHLWMPAAVAGLFTFAFFYEQQIFVQLGLSTYAQLRLILPYAIQIGIWLSLAYLVTRIADVTVWDPISRRVPVPKLLRDVTRVLVYSLAISGIIGAVFRKDVSAFWTAGGAVGIVVGLALRNVIVDVFMGLAMNFDQPFSIGDFIQIANGPTGRVVELNWRTTRVLTSDGNLVVIPNGKLGELTVTNFSKPSQTSEVGFVVSLDSTVPPERALRILTAGAMSVAGTNGILEEPPPKARVSGFTGVGVEYKVKYSIDPRLGGPGKAKHTVMRAVLEQLHFAGVHLAMNKQEVIAGQPMTPYQDPKSLDDRAALLARTEIFRGLDDTSRQHLAVRMQERLVLAGQSVVEAGAPGDSMFVIFEGLLHAQVQNKERQSIVRVGALPAGSFFGEISALTGEPRTATVIAACDSLIFEIQKDAFASLIATRPDVLHTLGDAIVARRTRTAEALAKDDAARAAVDERGFARQLIDRMMGFFHIGDAGRKTPPRGGVQVPEGGGVSQADTPAARPITYTAH